MKYAAARAIAALVATEELSQDHVISQALDRRVAPTVAAAVARAALDTGLAGVQVTPEEVADQCRQLVSQQVHQGGAAFLVSASVAGLGAQLLWG